MILYLDTSALVKLYSDEPGSDEVRGAVEAARTVAVSEVGYVEVRSALARKEREALFSAEEHDAAVQRLREDFREVYLARPVTGEVVVRAGELVREHALRAYDAVHLATALLLRKEAEEVRGEQAGNEEGAFRVEFLAYDSSLMGAAREEGFAHEPEVPTSNGGGE